MQDLEERYGFAKALAALTKEALVHRFNGEVGNPGCGSARMYFLSCLGTELRKRHFDASGVLPASGLNLQHEIRLVEGKLEKIAAPE